MSSVSTAKDRVHGHKALVDLLQRAYSLTKTTPVR